MRAAEYNLLVRTRQPASIDEGDDKGRATKGCLADL